MACPVAPNPGDEPIIPTNMSNPKEFAHAALERKQWADKCAAKQRCEAHQLATLNLIAHHQFPTCSKQLFDDGGFFPPGETAIQIWDLIKDAACVKSKVDEEILNLREEAKKLKPSHTLGPEAHLVKQRKIGDRSNDLENPVSTKEKQAIIRSVHNKSEICAPTTIKGAFNRVKITGAEHTQSGGFVFVPECPVRCSLHKAHARTDW